MLKRLASGDPSHGVPTQLVVTGGEPGSDQPSTHISPAGSAPGLIAGLQVADTSLALNLAPRAAPASGAVRHCRTRFNPLNRFLLAPEFLGLRLGVLVLNRRKASKAVRKAWRRTLRKDRPGAWTPGPHMRIRPRRPLCRWPDRFAAEHRPRRPASMRRFVRPAAASPHRHRPVRRASRGSHHEPHAGRRAAWAAT